MTVYGIFSRSPPRPARGGETRFGDLPSPTAAPHRLGLSGNEDRASTLYDTTLYTMDRGLSRDFEKKVLFHGDFLGSVLVVCKLGFIG